MTEVFQTVWIMIAFALPDEPDFLDVSYHSPAISPFSLKPMGASELWTSSFHDFCSMYVFMSTYWTVRLINGNLLQFR